MSEPIDLIEYIYSHRGKIIVRYHYENKSEKLITKNDVTINPYDPNAKIFYLNIFNNSFIDLQEPLNVEIFDKIFLYNDVLFVCKEVVNGIYAFVTFKVL